MVVEVALGIRLEPVFATAGLSFALLQPVGDGVCWVLVALEGDDAGGLVGGVCWCSVAGGCCVWCPDAGGCCC